MIIWERTAVSEFAPWFRSDQPASNPRGFCFFSFGRRRGAKASQRRLTLELRRDRKLVRRPIPPYRQNIWLATNLTIFDILLFGPRRLIDSSLDPLPAPRALKPSSVHPLDHPATLYKQTYAASAQHITKHIAIDVAAGQHSPDPLAAIRPILKQPGQSHCTRPFSHIVRVNE